MARKSEAAALAIITYQARKGDIVAVERRHSSTYVHGATVRHSTWHIGRAASVRKDGFVKTVTADLPTETGHAPFRQTFGEYERTHNMWAAYTIRDAHLRAAAETLIPCSFDSGEALKAAIVAAVGKEG